MSTASWWGQRTTLQLKIQRHVNQNHGIQQGYFLQTCPDSYKFQNFTYPI